MSTGIDRRRLLRMALTAAAAGTASQLGAANAFAGFTQSRWGAGGYPFRLGVASGDPVNDGFVLWTRLAPDPFDPTVPMPDAVAVEWEVARDPGFRDIAQSGLVQARRELAHSVRVETRGLEPGRPYWYRFGVKGGDWSPAGRSWTALPPSARMTQLRIAHASCQHYEQGYFSAYDVMADDAPDLVVHLGDYIYESSWGTPVRRHDGPEPFSLAEYRARHALYKLDASLARMHALCPWLVTWDDHEVDNDYASLNSEDYQDPSAFARRRAAAYQAYFEHMPIRTIATPREREMRLYQRSIFGDLAEVVMMDTRQFRSPHACRTPERGGGQVVPNSCPDLSDPSRTTLGADQERWLTRGFTNSRALWNVIGGAQMFSRLRQKTASGEEGSWTDDWNGYPEARKRVTAAIETSRLSNPVFIGGDIHSYWVNDVKADFARPDSATLATEIVGTSITSAAPNYELFSRLLPENPHIRFFDSRKRGYVLNTLSREGWQAELRTVEDVTTPAARGSTLARFVIAAGRPGAQPA